MGGRDEARDRVLLARVQAAAVAASAGRLDLRHQRCQPLAVASAAEHGIALQGEPPRNCGADIIAGADYRDAGIPWFGHRLLSRVSWIYGQCAFGKRTRTAKIGREEWR